jgi:hypothetical protein
MISVMLSSTTLTRVFIASGALWCVAAVAAVSLRPAENNAQAPLAEPAPAVLAATTPKSDRLPIYDPFGERWPTMVSSEPVMPVARRNVPQTVGATVSARRHHTRRDRVCENGRRYFTLHRHRYWRCRR